MKKKELLRIENRFDHILVSLEKMPDVHGTVMEIIQLCDKLEDSQVCSDLKEIAQKIDTALSLVDYGQVVVSLCRQAKQYIMDLSGEVLEQLQREIEQRNIEDFYVISSDGYKLVLAGSFDFSYYHEIEIIFTEVEFICCPGSVFKVDRFRKAEIHELEGLSRIMNGYEKQGIVVCMEDTFSMERYYITAHQVSYSTGMVYYYKRDNLLPGERIADWVK